MSLNALQLFTALTSIVTCFLCAYAVVVLFWFQKISKLYEEDKEAEEQLRVAKQQTTGVNMSSVGVGSSVGSGGKSGFNANVFGGFLRKKAFNADARKPKWQRFRMGHNLFVEVFVTKRRADDPPSPTVLLAPGMSRRASFRSVSSEQHSQNSSSPRSPYVVTSNGTDRSNGSPQGTNSIATLSNSKNDDQQRGIMRPSSLSNKLIDAVRTNFANPGLRVMKKSKRAQRSVLHETNNTKTKDSSITEKLESNKNSTITSTTTTNTSNMISNNGGRKYVPPSCGSKSTSALGEALPTSGFLRASSLGTNVLETMSMRAPYLVRTTTTSIEIRWEPWIVGNESRLKMFEVSWRIVSGQQGIHSLEGWSSSDTRIQTQNNSDSIPRDRLHYEASIDRFSPIPRLNNSPNYERKLIIQGLPSNCPLVEFRVRSRINLSSIPSLFKHKPKNPNINGRSNEELQNDANTLWGPYSVSSVPLRTLDATAPPPMTGAITAGAIELRWGPPRDPRYGKTEGYTLAGKKAGNDTFVTIKSGSRIHSCSIRSVNSIPLTPNTTYVFKLTIRTASGELVSNNLPVTTLPAPPEAPMPPVVVRTTARLIELRWEAPDDHGSPITRYVLYGRRHRTSRFKRLFTGLSNSFVCGAREDGDQLASDTLYVFKIKAVNGYGDSPASSVVTARTTQMSMAEAMSMAAGGSGSKMNDTNESKTGGETKTGVESKMSDRNIESKASSNGPTIGTDPSNSPLLGTSPSSPGGRGSRGSPVLIGSSSSPDVQRSSEGQKISSAPARVSELPNGWVECWDPGREICYYFNSLTGITQWIHPIHGKGGKDPDLNFRKKRFKLLYSIRERDWPQGGRKILKMTLRRSHLVIDSFEAIRRLDVSKLKLKTKVIFSGEEGIDSGGLTKEWFLELSRSLLDPQRCLLVKLEDSSTSLSINNSGIKMEKYHIDYRSSINDQHLQYFHFLGILLAKAIYDRQLIDLPLCKAVYKFILGRPATLDDLEEMDPLYHRSIVWMLKNDITDVIYENFTIAMENFGQMQEIELIPGGKEIKVTNKNKARYVQAILDWKTSGSVLKQLKSIRQGFQEVLPPYEIKDFTEDEINLLLNGKQHFNVNDMRQATRYTGGYDANSLSINIFWSVLEKFSQSERGQLLQFATGSSKIPLDGYDPCFTITMATSDAGTDALPTSHTCFNQLVLPKYETEKEMTTKLLYAFENAGGFHMS